MAKKKKNHVRDCHEIEQPARENEGAGEEGELEQRNKQIIESGSVTMSNGRHLIHCLTVIGQIEGHFILPPQNKTTKYEHVIPQIVAVEEDPAIEGLLIILNTVGGDVEAGLAIAELIAGMRKPTVSLVLGGGHSIGVPLAVCARHSFIAPTATMTLHPVRMNGIVVGVPQTLNYFDRMQDRIVKFVCQNSHISAARFKQLMMNTGELVMDVGTVLEGDEAVREGLIDSPGGLSEAIACLNTMIEAEKPAEDKADGKKTPESEKQENGGPAGRAKKASGEARRKPGRPAAGPRPRADSDGRAARGKQPEPGRRSEPDRRPDADREPDGPRP